jgi:hypothetical protein
MGRIKENKDKKSIKAISEGSVNIEIIDKDNILLFSDLKATQLYKDLGMFEDFLHDLKFSVMRGESWNRDELEYAREIKRLLNEGIIVKKGVYWWTSPHSPVYCAKKEGHIRINGKFYKFTKGEEITFQCRMAMEQMNLKAPLLIKKFKPTDKTMLCGEMKNSMKGM